MRTACSFVRPGPGSSYYFKVGIWIALPATSRPVLEAPATSAGRCGHHPQASSSPAPSVRLVGHSGGIRREAALDAQAASPLTGSEPGEYRLTAPRFGFPDASRTSRWTLTRTVSAELHFTQISGQTESLVISAQPFEPSIDLRNAEVLNAPCSRATIIVQQLDAGHQRRPARGGGKSLEIAASDSTSTTAA